MIIEKKNHIPCLKYASHDTPHATIETNRTCNIECRCCYNLDRETVKSVKQIKTEIDLACTRRNLNTITILGGEPTLHPDLPEIVSYIKSKRLVCQILTNGIIFMDGSNDQLLNMLIAAGTDRLLLHIDEGQKGIHDDIDEARCILFEKCEEKKMKFSLSITIFDENTQTIPLLIKRYSKYKYFDGILSILYKNTDPNHAEIKNGRMVKEYQSIKHILNLEPVAFIPSNIDDRQVNWLIYYYFVTTQKNLVSAPSPVFFTLLRKLYRIFRGRHIFAMAPARLQILLLFFTNSVFRIFTSLNLIPMLLRNIYLALSNSLQPRFHYTVIQEPPQVYNDTNEIRICHACPDATIRNGHLLPVCIADMISSLTGRSYPSDMTDTMVKSIVDHIDTQKNNSSKANDS